jgi:hypothetical protein
VKHVLGRVVGEYFYDNLQTVLADSSLEVYRHLAGAYLLRGEDCLRTILEGRFRDTVFRCHIVHEDLITDFELSQQAFYHCQMPESRGESEENT